MSKWKVVKLKEICTINMGQSPESSSYNQIGDGIPFYQGNADFGELNPITRFYCTKPTKIAAKGDILLSVRAPIGALNIASDTCCIGRGLAAISPRGKITETKYLFYVLKHKNPELNHKGTGSTFKAINKQSLSQLQCPLPPLEIQQSIYKTLDAVQELLALRRQQLAELDNLIKSTFYDMFGDPVVNDKGWEIKSLGHLLEDIRYGTSTPPRFSDSGYCFVRATNIKSGRIIDTEMKFISENEAERISKCRLQDGDLIIVRSGVNSGDTCVIDEIFAGQFAGYDLIITPNKALLNSIYLNELINTNYMSQVVKPLTRRAAQPHLNAEQVKNLPIVLPIVDLQNKFAIKVKRIEEQKYIVKKAIEETQYLFDSLMSEYFD